MTTSNTNTTPFTFRPEIRGYVKSLCQLAEYANARDTGRWAHQSSNPEHDGVFGSAMRTVEYIIREECGQEVLDAINHSRHGYNFGGCGTFFEDVECTVQEALNKLAEEKLDAMQQGIKENDQAEATYERFTPDGESEGKVTVYVQVTDVDPGTGDVTGYDAGGEEHTFSRYDIIAVYPDTTEEDLAADGPYGRIV
jgi:hypothetical protein